MKGGVWTLANNMKHHSLFFTQKPSFCLYVQLIGRVSAGLRIGLLLEKDFCGTVRSLKCMLLTHRASVHGKLSLW